MSAHDAVEVIIAKRDRAELSDSQIEWVVDAYTLALAAVVLGILGFVAVIRRADESD